MKRFVSSHLLQLLTVAMLWFAVGPRGEVRGSDDNVVIALKPEVKVEHTVVRLGDIADITAESPLRQRALRETDVVDLTQSEGEVTITDARVQIRLALAGFDVKTLRWAGAAECHVRYVAPPVLSDLEIEAAARKMLADRYQLAEDDLEVNLAESVVERLPVHLRTQPGLRVEVTQPPHDRLGALSLGIRLVHDGDVVNSRNVRFTVLRRFRVAVAKSSQPIGETLNVSDFDFERRFLAAHADEPTEEQIAGKSLRQGLRAGEVIQLRYLYTETPAQSPWVIRPRDEVHVVAVSGGIQIVMTKAEALASGRVGDTISIRNRESQRIVTARVTGPGEVEIQLR